MSAATVGDGAGHQAAARAAAIVRVVPVCGPLLLPVGVVDVLLLLRPMLLGAAVVPAGSAVVAVGSGRVHNTRGKNKKMRDGNKRGGKKKKLNHEKLEEKITKKETEWKNK